MLHTQKPKGKFEKKKNPAPKPKPKIEIVDVYPEKHQKGILATYHIYLIDKDLDIRGGKAFIKEDGKLFVENPQAQGTDDETGELIQFPVVSFPDKIYERAFRYEVVKEVRRALQKKKLI